LLLNLVQRFLVVFFDNARYGYARAPSRANANAAARPIPVPAPVTKATLPANFSV
jgi:hypothetical protein